jgi:hypothetical protein
MCFLDASRQPASLVLVHRPNLVQARGVCVCVLLRFTPYLLSRSIPGHGVLTVPI